MPLDLLFQNETAKIARIVCQDKSIASADHSVFPPPPSPSPSLISPTVEVEDMAWKYYLLNFNITRNKPDCFHGAYLAGSSTGMASVTSVGLAALAFVRQDPHMMQLARRKYSAALKLMAQAMHDPQELLNGATTTASFNLSIFEMMTSQGPDAAYSWLRHIHGTAALMRVELIPSHESVFGTSLTGRLQILFTVAMGCLISEQLVPPHVVRFATSLTLPAMSADVSLVIELFILLSDVINLYLEAKMFRSGDQRPTDITAALNKLSADLLNWESRLPPLWTSAPYDEASNWVSRLLGGTEVLGPGAVSRAFPSLETLGPEPLLRPPSARVVFDSSRRNDTLSARFLGPCGMNTAPVRNRATELNVVVKGRLVTNSVLENGAAPIENTMPLYQMAVFPQGAIHQEFNSNCEDTVFVAGFNNADPGVSQVARSFFSLRKDVVQATLGGIHTLNGQDLESFREMIPANIVLGIEACLAKCGLSKNAKRDVSELL
ncbi:hypothetical protein BDW74DRAFT_178230 [Aspergillus multicolor]|uniref:uncharacterized protein n=1 Tax=Aspergillus multicolor TaxID=41759 RepID=UPI003CCE1859